MQEKTYTTIDKSTWDDGPWKNEPDKVQWKDEETGLPCLAKRNHFGVWCGYVGVNPDHPWHGIEDYDELNLQVHGGITFADSCQEGDEATSICHIPEPGEPDNVWWFGFDCGHGYDLMPGLIAREREYGIVSAFTPFEGTQYRDLVYVQRECGSLARQLKR